MWKNWIPGYGDKKVRQRIWELEQKAGSLPTLFAVLMGSYIVSEAQHSPIPLLPPRYKVLIAAVVVAILFIYRDERERATKKAKDKAKEITRGENQASITDFQE